MMYEETIQRQLQNITKSYQKNHQVILQMQASLEKLKTQNLELQGVIKYLSSVLKGLQDKKKKDPKLKAELDMKGNEITSQKQTPKKE